MYSSVFGRCGRIRSSHDHMLVGIYVTSSFSDPFSLNPDPAKNLNPADPDPSYSLTLPGNDKKCVFF